MKRDFIEVNPDSCPYEFEISLADETFLLGLDYNETGEFFTVSLAKLNEETAEYDPICDSEPIIYGVQLWQDVYRSGRFPAVAIVPLDESGGNNAVTFDNLNTTVFLTIEDSRELKRVKNLKNIEK